MASSLSTDLWSLREIYRKRLRRMRRYGPEVCDDLASEMLTLALENQRARGIEPQNNTVKWLLATARARVVGNWRWMGSGYCEYTKSPAFPVMSEEDFEAWLSANWLSFSNRNNGNGKAIARYRIAANGMELSFDARELGELLRGSSKLTDSQLVTNFLRRGRTMWCMDGKLFPTLSYAKKERGLKPWEKCPGYEVRITGHRLPDERSTQGRAEDMIRAL